MISFIHALFLTTALVATTGSALPHISRDHELESRALTLPPGWSDRGCVKDYNTRILSGYSTSTTTMTGQACAAICQRMGYVYAGTEWYSQCYCGNTLGTTVASTQCVSPCRGDETQMCGGNYAMNLYAYTNPVLLASSTTSTSIRASTSTTSISSSTKASTSSTSVRPSTSSTTVSSTSARPSTSTTTVKPSTTTAIVSTTSRMSSSTRASTSSAPVTTSTTASSRASSSSLISSTRAATSSTPVLSSTTTSSKVSSTSLIASTTSKISSTLSIPPTSTTSLIASTSSVLRQPTTSIASTSSSAAPPVQTNPLVSIPISRSAGEKKIWAHHMVGNTYPYTYDSWVNDINLAQSAGIDGFALNIGPDEWQPSRVADAYRAAQALGFDMFLSFDMSTFDCVSTARLAYFQNYLATYLPHPAAGTYEGKSILSTFGGEWCTFGQADVNTGWQTVMGARRNATYFMPAYTPGDGPRSLNKFDIDAQLNWNSGWPTGNQDLTVDNDNYWLSYLPDKYVAAVSPEFFTHFSYKNWIYRSDNFLYSQRWEMLLGLRNKVDQVEIISWNDYGESHYIGQVTGDQPPESKVWTMNPTIDHTAYLSLQAFYSQAWKSGSIPAITTDKIWLTSRPHSKDGVATGDSVGSPDGADYTEDNFYAQVHLKADATIVLSTNKNTQSFVGKAGVNRVSLPLEAGSGIKVQVVRGGATVASLSPSFTYVINPVQYNFNYLIWQS